MFKRGSGVLAHISSLPSAYGIGDLGPSAFSFVDSLAKAKQHYWQVLPLNQTNAICGHSPYSSDSAFAGNVLLISPDQLLHDGFLLRNDIPSALHMPVHHVDFSAVYPLKIRLLERAYETFITHGHLRSEYQAFTKRESSWLEDYALFAVIKKNLHCEAWSAWPHELASRTPEALERIRTTHRESCEKEKFYQFLFYRQWHALRAYAQKKGVSIIGDIPIYVSYDSVDVWTHPSLFKLDQAYKPIAVAGVPPDYFSKTGQLWGNPVYAWDMHEKEDFAWWKKRISHNLDLFDVVRIDHFRGLIGYWEVAASESTAMNGKWVPVPFDKLYEALLSVRDPLPLVAEDLGIITDDVREALEIYNIPGMRILLFAFGSDQPTHPYLPHNFAHNTVVYTGTHDNNTTRGWFRCETNEKDRRRINDYLGKDINEQNVHWEFIRMGLASVAQICLIPLQDILGFDEHARMNTPSVAQGNWAWRVAPDQLHTAPFDFLAALTTMYARDKQDSHEKKH